MTLTRRELLKTGISGLGALTLGSMTGSLQAAPTSIQLTMREALVEMVDLKKAYMWLFDDGTAPRFPGPVLYVTEGEHLFIDVTNDLPIGDHAFSIPGVITSNTIKRGQTRRVVFDAPPAGTYIYLDPMSDPINRVMGLHGVMVSMPRGGKTPYSTLTPSVRNLFQDFGKSSLFPGASWAPEQTKIWAFHQVDPELNLRIGNGETITPAEFGRQFLPKYFTLNGRAGYFAAHAPDTELNSTVGYPHLIRNTNTGLWIHSPHVHANHVYQVAINGVVQENVYNVDTYTLRPMDRIDVVYPYTIPPDIPEDTWQRIVDGVQEEPFPMRYPMHCHTELSQTAAGGNYPHGCIADINFLGPHNQIAYHGNPPEGYPVVPGFPGSV